LGKKPGGVRGVDFRPGLHRSGQNHAFDNNLCRMLSIIIFAAFCFGTSAIYILNDIFDRENDKKHPIKSSRPIASGKIPLSTAMAFSLMLMVISLALAVYCNTLSVLTLLAYIALNLAYSAFLKHVVIIDVMSIAAGFVLRAAAGGFAIEVPVSPWLLVCTTLLALFLGFGVSRWRITPPPFWTR
jgi:4-hydroxybenzoate polyprenyltransferase